MKTMKYIAKTIAILLFSLLLVQHSFAQRYGGGGRSRFNHSRSFNGPRFYGNSPYRSLSHYNGNNYYHTNQYFNYNRPMITNRFYYGGGFHLYPSYYRPFSSSLFGININVLPMGYYPFSMGRNRYFYNNGMYYQPYQGYYQTIAPPLGAVVPSLPAGASSVFIDNQNYYEYNGTYYQQSFNGHDKYEVVGVNGILKTAVGEDEHNDNKDGKNNNQPITSLPENFKTVVLDNKVYYVTPSGEYYTKNIDENGNITFSIEAK